MKSNTETIIKAMRILSAEIHSDDGLANAAIAEAADRLDELQQRNAELAAQVELLRNGVTHFNRSRGDMNPLLKAYLSTPAQCLAEVKAQAGRDGFLAGIDARRGIEYDVHNGDWKAADRAADEYANTIRNQEGR